MAAPGGAVGSLDDLDHVPGVLGGDDRGCAVQDPVHQLQDVLEDVLLGEVTVAFTDVWQKPLVPAPVGIEVAFGRSTSKLAPRVFDRLAVEREPGNRARRPEVRAAEPRADATGGGVRRLSDGSGLTMPRILGVRSSDTLKGDDWIGLKVREASVVRGIGVLPVFAGLLGLLLLVGSLGLMWGREGR